MIRNLQVVAIGIWMISLCIIGRTESPATLIRVSDMSRVGGLAGIVLLVNPGDAHKSQALITDSNGAAIVPGLHCEICTVSAFDPRGLFFSKTMEFSSRSSSLTLTLEVRPVINKIADPGSIPMNVVILSSGGVPMAQQEIVIRPSVMTLDSNWMYIENTDSRGQVPAQLHPGEYTVAALSAETTLEATFQIANAKSKCAENAGKCVVTSPGARRSTQVVRVQLSPASAISQ